jgi:hypothetical protein
VPGSPTLRLGSLALAVVVAIGCAGCARSQMRISSQEFLSEHQNAAVAAAAAMRAADLAASSLRGSPTAAELAALTHDASQARRRMRAVSEWSVSEGGEEEDVPRAEGELVEASDEFVTAMSSLLSYGRAPAQATLAVYRQDLARGREKWNEGIGELWHVGGRSGSAPTV